VTDSEAIQPVRRRVLVLGGTGKMGRVLARVWDTAPPEGWRPTFAVRGSAPLPPTRSSAASASMSPPTAPSCAASSSAAPDPQAQRSGDVLSLEDLEAQIAQGRPPQFESVLALWGVTSGDAAALAGNTALALRAVDIARAVGAARLFHASSSAIYSAVASSAPLPEEAVRVGFPEGRVHGVHQQGEARAGLPDTAPAGGYGAAKYAMEAAIATSARQDPVPQQIILRFANLAGGDSLFAALNRRAAAAAVPQMTLDQFENGRGPLRSYIAPVDLAHVMEALLNAPGDSLPAVINCAAGGAIAMEDIARAAGAQVQWRPAPKGAVPCVALDLTRLARLAPDVAQPRSGADLVAQVAGASAHAAARPSPGSQVPASRQTPMPQAAAPPRGIAATSDPARPIARSKRVMDVIWALLLILLLWPLIMAVAAWVLLLDGRPVFYKSERMRSPTEGFDLWKFRTMRPDGADRGVSGGDKRHRITRSGVFLRRYRLDELPQLWNILRGDISFVGPRPPLRHYVEAFPDLYAAVLRSRPGVTGLATLAFHAREEALLAPCADADETEAVYIRRCIPAKAHLDLIYQRNRSICWDHWLILATVFRRFPLRGPTRLRRASR